MHAQKNLELYIFLTLLAYIFPIFSRENTEEPPRIEEIESIQPFTGRVTGKRVRMRLQPQLDSAIICELQKNQLLQIVGIQDGFYAVTPPPEIHGYVFRSFVLDDVIEGSKVNMRMNPSKNALVLTQLNTGDKIYKLSPEIEGSWIEIAMPKHVIFYVSKDFIVNVGPESLYQQWQSECVQAEHMLHAAQFLMQTELSKPFDQIDMTKLLSSFEKIIAEYRCVPSVHRQAKQEILQCQQIYLEKKIAFLQPQAQAVQVELDDAKSSLTSLQEDTTSECMQWQEDMLAACTDKMRIWQHAEDVLYEKWKETQSHSEQDQTYFYEEQKNGLSSYMV